MRIFRVRVDVNKYQYFLPEDESIHETDRLRFDGTPKLDQWVPPSVYVYEPKLKRGNFLSFMGGGGLIVDSTALEAVRMHLEMAGELLPLPHEGELFHVLNITECINALDQQKTEWVLSEEGQRLWIKKHAFHRHRMSESSLFKIPEAWTDVLTYEGLKDPEDEFKPSVERAGLTGLVFDEIWSDEG